MRAFATNAAPEGRRNVATGASSPAVAGRRRRRNPWSVIAHNEPPRRGGGDADPDISVNSTDRGTVLRSAHVSSVRVRNRAQVRERAPIFKPRARFGASSAPPGREERRDSLPRVALVRRRRTRSTRGYIPSPLRGWPMIIPRQRWYRSSLLRRRTPGCTSVHRVANEGRPGGAEECSHGWSRRKATEPVVSGCAP